MAKDKCTGNEVVVKLSSIPKKPDRLESPASEIDILAKLRDSKQQEGHQYIINLVEAFPVSIDGDDQTCMVIEYASGGDLLDKIVLCEERKKKMSFSKIRNYVLMMAKGIDFLHSQGIVHMDLSLENMLLTSKDEIRICDFGQAQEQTQFRAFSPRRGKIGYMAPEVFKYHAFDGRKADVWSLGVIFWSLLANGSLYEKPIPSDPHFAYVEQGKDGLKQLFEGSDIFDVPESCLDLLSKMLSVSPKQRFTIEQVLEHPWFKDSPNSNKSATKNQLQVPDENLSHTTITSSSTKSSAKRSLIVRLQSPSNHSLSISEISLSRISESTESTNISESTVSTEGSCYLQPSPSPPCQSPLSPSPLFRSPLLCASPPCQSPISPSPLFQSPLLTPPGYPLPTPSPTSLHQLTTNFGFINLSTDKMFYFQE